MDMVSHFQQVWSRHCFVRPGEKIFVACSGGPDSVALYFLLKQSLPSKKGPGILHFNHKLRGKASDQDENFVRSLAKKEKTRFICGRADSKKNPKKSIEEAARHDRYAFFQEASKKYRIAKIATAHTLDDQAETVLMRVLQGTGPQGLSGIRRSYKTGAAHFVRPLLDFRKGEILKFLKENHIPFRKDESNDSQQFLRNRIRAGLLPQLSREFNPRVHEALARIPAILEEENELLETLKAQAWKKCFRRKKNGVVGLKRGDFNKLSKYLQFWVLDRALKTLDPLSGMSFEAWQKIKPRLESRRFRWSLPKEVDLELTPGGVGVYKRLPKTSRP